MRCPLSGTWQVLRRKNKVHRLFCLSYKVSIEWWSVNNTWPIAVSKPTVCDAIQFLLPHHTHVHKSASENSNKNRIITKYSYSCWFAWGVDSLIRLGVGLSTEKYSSNKSILYLVMYFCCKKIGQLWDSKQVITVSMVNGKCVLLSLGICSPLFELDARLHSFQMFQTS